MIVALAGRRVDPADASEARFPTANVPRVREELTSWFRRHLPVKLVCSAAAGADLLALEAAGLLNIERRIILPFPVEAFKAQSVCDRPGPWENIFDKVISEVRQSGNLVILEQNGSDSERYIDANLSILEVAKQLAAPGEDLTALVVWDGQAKQSGDMTAHFLRSARWAGFRIEEISTIGDDQSISPRA